MSVVRMNFLSKMLGMQTNVTICLPTPSFSEMLDNKQRFYVPGMRYQVLYLLHGGNGDDQDYVTNTSISRYADEQKVVVVMPNDYNASYTDRTVGPLYYRFITEELTQMLRAYFPVSSRREDTFVAGLSMGGEGAMKLALRNPEMFCSCLCMSGVAANPDMIAQRDKMFAFPADPDAPRPMGAADIYGDLHRFQGSEHDMWHQARQNLELGRAMPRFYLTVGDQDHPQCEFVQEAYAFLKGLGYDATLDVVPGYRHEWDFWDSALRKAFRGWFNFRGEALYPEK